MVTEIYSGYTDIQFIKYLCSFNVQIWSNIQTFAKYLSKITTNKGKICQKDKNIFLQCANDYRINFVEVKLAYADYSSITVYWNNMHNGDTSFIRVVVIIFAIYT